MSEQLVDDRQPILSMMVKPRETFQYAIGQKNFSLSLYIGAIGGFGNALMGLFQTKYPSNVWLFDIVYSSFITGILYYLLISLVTGYLLKVIGGLFGGKAAYKELFQTLCLVSIPYIWLLPIILFWMQLAPNTFFEVNIVDLEFKSLIGLYCGSFVIIAAAIWSFVLSLVGISEAMKFSKWKAFFTLCIVSVISVILLSVMGGIF